MAKIKKLPIAYIGKDTLAKWVVGVDELFKLAKLAKGEFILPISYETIDEIKAEFNKLYE
jgi:hypothetical protein